MGSMTFLPPSGLSQGDLRELERSCVAGGPDNMPWPTGRHVDRGKLILQRDVDESGYVLVPWRINGVGRVMTSTATLMERPHAYHLAVELARGKMNHLRNQVADWQVGGLQLAPELEEEIFQATLAFGKAATATV